MSADGKNIKPLLSVTLVSPTTIDRIEGTIAALMAQSIRDRMEVIFIVPCGAVTKKQREEWGKVFCKVKVIEKEKITNVSKVAFEGVPDAEGEVIVFMEDHVYPVERWAEHLMNAHQNPYVAVGSNFLNANPETGWSWSALFLYYGPVSCQSKSKETADLPLHNVSYKIEVIRPYFGQFSTFFEDWENGLHPILRKNGHLFFLEKEAKIFHQNPTKAGHLNKVSFAAGRLYIWHRARKGDWSLARRFIYLFGSPIIPFLRTFQFWRLLKQDATSKYMPVSGWIALFVQLIYNGMGQAWGLLFGKGNASEVVFQIELVDRRSIS